VVNKTARLGGTGKIDIQVQSVYSKSMTKLTSVATSGKIEVSLLTSVTGHSSIVENYALSQNYPNPFNPSTTIEFALPKDSKVEIKIYNILGVQMATLYSGNQTAGYHQVVWDAATFSSGVYFYVMKATSTVDVSGSSLSRGLRF